MISFCKCSNNNKINLNENNSVFEEFTIDDKLYNILSEYVKENECDSCWNHLFIDKVIEKDFTIITIISEINIYERKSYFPHLTINIEGIPFYVYSGIENFIIKKDNSETGYYTKSNCNGYSWYVFYNDGKYSILKNELALPFFMLPSQVKDSLDIILEERFDSEAKWIKNPY